MRVIWVAPNGGNYQYDSASSGGWISSLETNIVKYSPNFKLGILFLSEENLPSKIIGQVSYLPINIKNCNYFKRWINHLLFRYPKKESNLRKKIICEIDSFKPDIVHIWGTETFPIGIVEHIKYPVVVHIQGFASSVFNSYLPLGYSKLDLKKYDGFFNCFILNKGEYFFYKYFKYRSSEEIYFSKYIKNWIGRTDWDKECSKILNPDSRYFHCDELIRDVFSLNRWTFHYVNHLNIFTTVGESWYKGIEQILLTAEILTRMNEKFTWRVCGVAATSKMVRYFERKTGINAANVNVEFVGRLTADEICVKLQSADVYVHTSHIENSSNALAEAMLLGVPCIAEYVGGNSTVLNNPTVLVQPYDSKMMAAKILNMKNEKFAIDCSDKVYYISRNRHKPQTIMKQLIDIYTVVIANRG